MWEDYREYGVCHLTSYATYLYGVHEYLQAKGSRGVAVAKLCVCVCVCVCVCRLGATALRKRADTYPEI